MSKYALAKELLTSGYEQGKALSLGEADVAEVMITSAIQELIRVKGGAYTKNFYATKPIRYQTRTSSKFNAANYWRHAKHRR